MSHSPLIQYAIETPVPISGLSDELLDQLGADYYDSDDLDNWTKHVIKSIHETVGLDYEEKDGFIYFHSNVEKIHDYFSRKLVEIHSIIDQLNDITLDDFESCLTPESAYIFDKKIHGEDTYHFTHDGQYAENLDEVLRYLIHHQEDKGFYIVKVFDYHH